MITTDNHSASINTEEALEAEMSNLARLISIHAPHDGDFSSGIPGSYVGRDSQFNRDYNSFFGSPPRRDIEQLRQQAQVSD